MTAHPAPFSDVILDLIGAYLVKTPTRIQRVLDPFAGTGKIHQLARLELDTYGLEIEPEWAAMHEHTTCGDALCLPYPWGVGFFDAIITSPTYGNRMADHHNAKDPSRRITYRHKLERELHPNNSGQLQWGAEYRVFHRDAWEMCLRALRDSGLFIVNVSNHIRKGEEIDVVGFHEETLTNLGLTLRDDFSIPTPRMRYGANSDKRVEVEHVLVFQKSSQPDNQGVSA